MGLVNKRYATINIKGYGLKSSPQFKPIQLHGTQTPQIERYDHYPCSW
jgi:hypothetical protein